MSGNIGDRIRQLREDMEVSLDEIANEIGVTKATFSRYETGKINVKQDKIEKIAAFFDVTPAYLMGWEEHKNHVFLNLLDKLIDKTIAGKLEWKVLDVEGEFYNLLSSNDVFKRDLPKNDQLLLFLFSQSFYAESNSGTYCVLNSDREKYFFVYNGQQFLSIYDFRKSESDDDFRRIIQELDKRIENLLHVITRSKVKQEFSVIEHLLDDLDRL